MISKRFEVTVVDPISDDEFVWWYDNTAREGIESSLSQSGRILMVEGCENIYELVEYLAEHEFTHDIGLIKEVIDYEPIYDEMLIEFDLGGSS